MSASQNAKPSESQPKPLTVKEFFDLGLDGCCMSAAQIVTGLSYTTVFKLAHGITKAGRPETVKALEEWSKTAAKDHGVYISAQKTLGV